MANGDLLYRMLCGISGVVMFAVGAIELRAVTKFGRFQLLFRSASRKSDPLTFWPWLFFCFGLPFSGIQMIVIAFSR